MCKSNTPRTDAFIETLELQKGETPDFIDFKYSISFAHELEAELTAANAANEELRRDNKKLYHSKCFYQSRVDKLGMLQKAMRDPERMVICDILANGQMLPDPNKERYGNISPDLLKAKPQP